MMYDVREPHAAYDPNVIDIVCVTDSNYAPHFVSLLKSIEAGKGAEKIRVHAILDSVDEARFSKIAETATGLEIHPYHVADHKALKLPPILHISRATYLRLIMAELLPQDISRVIYLDIDMVVTGSLVDLWSTDLKGLACGAVQDAFVDPTNFARQHELPSAGTYFNAGVLLFDLDAIRATDALSQALDMLLAAPEKYEFADQDALNKVFWENWSALDAKWNFQRLFLWEGCDYTSSVPLAQALPRIIHFTESPKPWQAAEWHPYAWLYWKYLRRTPFLEEVMQREKVGWLRLLKFWLKFHLKKPRS